MTSTPALRRRGFGARLVPLVIALGALPLMAPTCGPSGEGPKIFARRSLIIPMDVCYQYQTDEVRTSYTPAAGTTACPTKDPGDVIRAYGLVYQLIRRGVAVYWVIDPSKDDQASANYGLTGVDLSVQYQGGAPVFLFDWTTGLEGAAPSIGTDLGRTIHYRGGPFVVDGSDFVKASGILQSLRSTFGNVNVHVANVAFRGYAKRTMAGGWSAGGATPPKLALLDIGSSGAGSKNSEVVIQGYLDKAGLNTPGAAGSATGTHGEIFDRLFMADFVPTVAGDWKRTNLAQNGYQILWVPHWTAPSSCSDCPPSTSCTCAVKYPAATISQALTTIGAFVNNLGPVTGTRGDLFAECAGIGSFEGVFGPAPGGNIVGGATAYPSTTGTDPTYGVGVPGTHFHTENTTGLWINKGVTGTNKYWGSFSSPLMQIGDYPFIARAGAIQNYRANDYKETEVVRLVSDGTDNNWDIFSYVPGNPAAHGTIVYLGGHSYSGTDGSFEVAGARLVLNTLFNLGATCTATGVACGTGLPGVCAAGKFICQGDQAVCQPDIQPGARIEICNGLDDDCDGQVDEGLQTDCYEAPPGYVDPEGRTSIQFAASKNFGVCRPGIQVCERRADGSYGMSSCGGQVLPVQETCNGLDDDCDGAVDEFGFDPKGLPSVACYDGPPGTQNVGECRGGTQRCQNGSYGAVVSGVFTPGACFGEVLPKPEVCTDAGAPGGAKDDDCDGQVNNGCTCQPGVTPDLPCFTGPGTPGVGPCHGGLQQCIAAGGGGAWGACTGQVVAQPESCVPAAIYDAGGFDPLGASSNYDTNCDGRVTRCPDCTAGEQRACYGNDPATWAPPSAWPPYAGVGQCTTGIQRCATDGSGKWQACLGWISPSVDLEGISIEYCDGKDNDCDGVTDESAVCGLGETCLNGVCVPSVCGTEMPAPDGYSCNVTPGTGTGTLTQDACGDAHPTGCPTGQVCQYGTCADPCPTVFDPILNATVSKLCGQGSTCSGGTCIGGSCYESQSPCAAGQICQGGSCVADACAGKVCPSGTFCRQGDCVQACAFVSCFAGQKCGVDGFCEPDPCAGRLCGAGQKCTNGTCAADPCLGKSCAAGQVCVADGGVGRCQDDPCTGVVCPVGQCAGGQCFATGNPRGAGSGAQTPGSSSSGCGCGSGGGPGLALPALLALLAVPLARRRRPGSGGRGALLVLLLSVALVASACKETKETAAQFDPSGCAATCGEQRCVDTAFDPSHCGACNRPCSEGEQCVSSVCGPSTLVAPFLRTPSPASGAKDGTNVLVSLPGDRLRENATLRVTTPSGLRTYPCPAAAGGTCQWVGAAMALKLDLTGTTGSQAWTFRVVNPDGVISNAVPFGITIPTPSLAGVTPNTVATGSSNVLEVSGTGSAGTGFTAGSFCRISGPGLSPPGLPLQSVLASTQQLDCVLDAALLAPGVYSLVVVSESGAVSNALSVTASPADPVVFALDPSSGTSVASFLVTGARFDPATYRVLFFKSPTLITDAAALVDPVYVQSLDAGKLFVKNLPLPAAVGPYSVAVRTGATKACTAGCVAAGARYSNPVTFSVGTAAVTITSFSPSTAYQGDPDLVLTFTGSNLPQNATIEVEPPGSTTFVAIPAIDHKAPLGCGGVPVTCTTVAAKKSLVRSAGTPQSPGTPEPEGQWLVRLRFGNQPGDATSAPWPLRVLSNQAILRDYAATPAPPQGGRVGDAKSTLSFQVSNVRGPAFDQVRVLFVGPQDATTKTTRLLVPNAVPTTGTTTIDVGPAPTALSLVGLPVGTYEFRVRNPNASDSNPLPFAVTPGAPLLDDAICVVQAGPCVQTALQRTGTVAIRLTGDNFAKPDAGGLNGSTVMVAADFSTNFPLPDPCDVVTTSGTQFQPVVGAVTVVDSKTIDVQVDARSAFVDPTFGTTYYVSVWNPSGGAGPQKSDCSVRLTNQTTKAPQLPWFKLLP